MNQRTTYYVQETPTVNGYQQQQHYVVPTTQTTHTYRTTEPRQCKPLSKHNN